VQESWDEKMNRCRQCKVFRSMFPLLSEQERCRPFPRSFY
jgi:hypothetical protein